MSSAIPTQLSGQERDMVKRANKRLTDVQLCFEAHMAELGLACLREFQFIPNRKWRADYRVGERVLLEIEGGAWVHGRHIRGAGFVNDCEKYLQASEQGYIVIRVTPQMVLCGRAKEAIRKIYGLGNGLGKAGINRDQRVVEGPGVKA